MSTEQTRLTDVSEGDPSTPTPYRTIVKDAYDTRDDGDTSDTTLEIVAWRVETVSDEDERESIKDENGNLDYAKILDIALADVGSGEISRRTGLKSYRDDRGGRAASTIRGYKSKGGWAPPKKEGGYASSHPVKRVLRRYARINDLGHFEDDESQSEAPGPSKRGPEVDAEPIDLGAMKRAYKLARSIASQNGFVFAPRSGDPVAVEDNERLDPDEIRPDDRPVGDTKAAAFVEKPNGSTYEYQIDLDTKDLVRDPDDVPPSGVL